MAKDRQGNDIGTQYHTGIYYTDEQDREIIVNSLIELQKNYDNPLAIEVSKLQNYYPAEAYHQKYLEKNPDGYCHIGEGKFEEVIMAQDHKLRYRPK
ncbi:hypothetical protein JCM14036_25550 [Desulfotomaculum defluvii]